MNRQIEAKWKIYSDECMPPNASPKQREDMRDSFFAGVCCLYQLFGTGTSFSLDEIVEELDDFWEDLRSRAGRKGKH